MGSLERHKLGLNQLRMLSLCKLETSTKLNCRKWEIKRILMSWWKLDKISKMFYFFNVFTLMRTKCRERHFARVSSQTQLAEGHRLRPPSPNVTEKTSWDLFYLPPTSRLKQDSFKDECVLLYKCSLLALFLRYSFSYDRCLHMVSSIPPAASFGVHGTLRSSAGTPSPTSRNMP